MKKIVYPVLLLLIGLVVGYFSRKVHVLGTGTWNDEEMRVLQPAGTGVPHRFDRADRFHTRQNISPDEYRTAEDACENIRQGASVHTARRDIATRIRGLKNGEPMDSELELAAIAFEATGTTGDKEWTLVLSWDRNPRDGETPYFEAFRRK